jgi:hypothetical protein
MMKSICLASLCFAACTTAPATPDQSDPVATYPTKTGTTIEIYAEGQAAYSVMERGDDAHPQLAMTSSMKTLSPTQIYMATATDATVPAGVIELTDSLVAAGRQFSSGPIANIAGQAEEAYSGCDASAFKHYWCSPAGTDISWCLLDHVGNQTKHLGSVSWVEAGVCMKKGGGTWNVTNGAGGNHAWSMVQGNYFHYSFDSAFLSSDWVHLDVTDAKTSTYQYAGFGSS